MVGITFFLGSTALITIHDCSTMDLVITYGNFQLQSNL